MIFKKEKDLKEKKLMEGISLELLCHGLHTLMGRFNLAGGHDLPMHSHPYEQTGYMLSGHMTLFIDGEEHDVKEGDSWCIPASTAHGAHIIEDSLVIEVFSPPREDYRRIGES